MMDEELPIFSLTENLSLIVPHKDDIIKKETNEIQRAIGMENFKSFNGRQVSPPRNSISARQRWREAARKIKFTKDPWAEFKIDKYPVECVIRHRYDPVKKEWRKDECVVRMEKNQFANGSMRACYRLKKLSNFSHEKCWRNASNYVAKCYLSADMMRDSYFDDVKLQMDAKLWAEIYNRFNPPKKIDMFQVSILEFKDRHNSPLFHLEHYIEGKYIKYNSNAGFVDDLHLRNTPHAFSHFTFECSNHEQIVVDVQGVGDLYTDPQIHTAHGTDYGDGNLGVRGIALFFYSHICNDICRSLGLTQFDLAPSELETNKNMCLNFSLNSKATKIKSDEEAYFSSKFFSKHNHLKDEAFDLFEADEIEVPNNCTSSLVSVPILRIQSARSSLSSIHNESYSSGSNFMTAPFYYQAIHSNNTSIVDSPFYSDEAFKYVNSKLFNKPRPSAVQPEKNNIFNADTEFLHRLQDFSTFESILGKVHLELCKYHEAGRFLTNETDKVDEPAAFFHLQQAANLGDSDALVNLAKIYMQLPHDILSDYKITETDENYDLGFDYMIEAAERGEKTSLHFVAKAYDSGIGLSKNKSIDWNRAVEYYRRIISENRSEKSNEGFAYSDTNSDFDSDYVIISRIGEMYLEGKNGIEKNPQEASDLFLEAADKAMLYGKGRLANKYYTLSDKAIALT